MNPFPSSWKLEPLNEVCSEIVDCVNKTAPLSEQSTPYKMIRTTNVRHGRIDVENARRVDEVVYRKWTRRVVPRRNDVVLTREAPLGEIGLLRSDDQVFLGQRTMLYRANGKDVNQHYLYYSFLGPTLQAQIKTLGSGSTVEHLRVPHAETLKIPYPPLVEQKKIAAVLSAYDELIEVNQRRIALLEKMAEELYREWFVRLRFPGHQKTKFNKGIPAGWGTIKFAEFCTLKRGYDLPNSLVEPGEYPVIASTSIKTYHNHFKVNPPVITTGRSGSLGTVLFCHKKSWPLNTSLYVKDFKGNCPYMIFYTLKNMNLENFNAGAGVPSLNRNHLSALKLARPTSDVQATFQSIIEPMFKEIRKLEEVVNNLKRTRDRLLPRLISGKLSVEELAISFPPGMEA